MEEETKRDPPGCVSPADSNSQYRNPTPPPSYMELAGERPEVIKNAGIMKTSVFAILLKLIKEVESHRENEDALEEDEVVDVSEEQQDQLSMLWDLSMDPDVARFLFDKECNGVSILVNAIHKSRAPRINEICIGILGNMCCVPEICEGLTQFDGFVPLISSLLGNIEFDPPTLKETMRLVQQALSTAVVSTVWLHAVRHTPGVLDLVVFVLRSATDDRLLMAAGELLDVLMDLCDDLCQQWATPALIDGMVTALHQAGHRETDTVRPFLHVFQLLSTSQSGVQALVEHGEGVTKELLAYLHQVCDEDILYVREHLDCLTSAISVLCLLLTTDNSVADCLLAKPSAFKDMMTVLESIYNVYGYQHPGNPAQPPACILRSSQTFHDSQASEHAAQGMSISSVKQSGLPKKSAGSSNTDSDAASDSDDVEGEKLHNIEKEIGQGRAVVEEERGEEREEDREEEREETESDGERLRILYDCLQEYFRFFFTCMTLDKDYHGEEAGKETTTSHAHRTEPSFRPVLKQLDKCQHRQITCLVSTLVYDVGASKHGQPARSGGTRSDEGWSTAQHLVSLCEALNFARTARVLRDSMESVHKTAGWAGPG